MVLLGITNEFSCLGACFFGVVDFFVMPLIISQFARYTRLGTMGIS
jgi:hypothetical protein